MTRTPLPRQYQTIQPYKVTDEMREKYNGLREEDEVLIESEMTYGNGIGVEPDGYMITKKVSIISQEKIDENCDCESNQALRRYSTTKATCGPQHEIIQCQECKEVIFESEM